MATIQPVRFETYGATAWDAADGSLAGEFLLRRQGDSVTYSATGLVDGSQSWTTNQWVGAVITANGSTGTVTANGATSLSIVSWTGGDPSNGTAYQVDFGVLDANTSTSVVKLGKAPDLILKVFFDVDPTELTTSDSVNFDAGMLHNWGVNAVLPYDAAGTVDTTDKITELAAGDSNNPFDLTQNWIDDLFDQGDLGTPSGRTNSFALRVVEDTELEAGDIIITEFASASLTLAAADFLPPRNRVFVPRSIVIPRGSFAA